jgi:mono/diheme cytochrome c family protein
VRIRDWVLLLAAIPCSLSIASRAQQLPESVPPPSSAVSFAAGKALYESIGCSACHGFSGQGGVASGPQIAPRVIPKAAFLYQLRHPRNAMPPYSAEVLSGQEADEIYEYLLSVPTPRAASGIQLLSRNGSSR